MSNSSLSFDPNVTPSPKIQYQLQPWVVCFTAALFFFYEFIQLNLFNSIGLKLMQDFSISSTALGFLSANYFYANLLFLFPAGLILDRYSVRRVILISLTLCIIATFCFAFTHNFYWASFFRFLTGIGGAFCFLSCIRLASRWFPSNKMALVSGLIVAMAMLGGMVAQMPLTALLHFLSWREVLIVDAIFGFAILIIIFILVKDYPIVHSSNSKNSLNEKISFWQNVRQGYFSAQNWLAGIYACMMNLPLAVLGALWGILYLNQIHNLTSEQSSLVISMLFVGMIIGAPLIGFLSDKFANRRIPMICASFVSLIIIYWIIEIPIYSVLGLMMLFLLLGFFTSTQVISYPIIAESNTDKLTATAVSVISFTTISGYVWSQPLFGSLLDWHWDGLVITRQAIYSSVDFRTALLILPIGFILALLAALALRETHGLNLKNIRN